jgi:tetratricopeptide (TPR) repeat protein
MRKSQANRQLRFQLRACTMYALRNGLFIVVLACWTSFSSAQDTLWDTYYQSGRKALEAKKFTEAEKLLKQAEREGLQNSVNAKAMMFNYYLLGDVYDKLNRMEEAETYLRKATTMSSEIYPTLDPVPIDLASTLARCYINRKKHEKAKPYLEWVIYALEKSQPKEIGSIAYNQYNLGLCEKQLKEYAAATKCYRTVIRLEDERNQTDSTLAAMAQRRLAEIKEDIDKEPEEALKLFLEAADRYQAAGVPGVDGAVETLDHAILLATKQKKLDEVKKLQTRVESMLKKLGADGKPNLAKYYKDRGWAAQDDGKHLDAEKWAKQAIDVFEAVDKPDVHHAYAFIVLGRSQHSRGLLREAEKSFDQAAKLVIAAKGEDELDTAWVLFEQADFLDEIKKYAEAIQLSETVFKIRLAKRGEDDLSIIPPLNKMAYCYIQQEKWPQALKTLDRIIALRQRIQGQDHEDLSWPLERKGYIYEQQDEKEAAEKVLKRALAIQEKKYGKGSEEAVTKLQSLARLMQGQGKKDEAEKLFRQAVQEREIVVGKDSPQLAKALNGLASFLIAEGKYEEAEKLLKQVVTNAEAAKPVNEKELATAIEELGEFYELIGRHAESIPQYQRAIVLWEKAAGSVSKELASVLAGAIWPYNRLDRDAEGEPLARRSVKIYESLQITNSSYARALNALAITTHGVGKVEEAEKNYRKALKVFEQDDDVDRLGVAIVCNNLANIVKLRGDFDEAEVLYRKSLQLAQKAGISKAQSLNARLRRASNMALSHGNLASLLSAKFQIREADSESRQALELREEYLGKTHHFTADNLDQLGDLAETRGEFAQADALHQRAADIRVKIFQPDEAQFTRNLSEVAAKHLRVGEFAQAEKLYQKIELNLNQFYKGDARELAWIWNARGNLAKTRDQLKQAEALLGKTLAEYRSREQSKLSLASLLQDLADLDQLRADFPAAQAKLKEAREILVSVYGEDSMHLMGITYNQLDLDLALGRFAQVRKQLKQIEKWWEDRESFAPQRLMLQEYYLALERNEGLYEKALKRADEILEIRSKLYGEKHYRSGFVWSTKATCLLHLNRPDEALIANQRGIDLLQVAYSENHRVRLNLLVQQAEILIEGKKINEGEALLLSLKDQQPAEGWNLLKQAELDWIRAKLMKAKMQKADATKLAQTVLTRFEKLYPAGHPRTRKIKEEFPEIVEQGSDPSQKK